MKTEIPDWLREAIIHAVKTGYIVGHNDGQDPYDEKKMVKTSEEYAQPAVDYVSYMWNKT